MENPTTLNFKEHSSNPTAIHATMKADTYDFQDYLAPQAKPRLVLQSEFRTAFICGYTNALHKTRTFSESLFSQPSADDEAKTAHIQEEVAPLMSSIGRTRPDIRAHIDEFLFANDINIHRNSQDLSTAFLAGYLTGIFKSGKYDRTLFLYGQQLHTTVFADLTMVEKSQEDALRASARIFMHTYGTKVTNLRGMVLGNSVLDDTGEVFDGDGTTGPSQR